MGGAGLQPGQSPLSALIPGSTLQNPQSGTGNLPIDPSQIAQLLQQNGINNIDPSQIAQFLQQNGQNIDPSQVAQFLQQNGQNIDPSQISQYLQNLQGGQSGQNGQNPPDAQNPLNSQDPQIHQYQPPDPNVSAPIPSPTDDNQDALFPKVSGSGSQGFGTPGVQINPLLLMKPTGPVDGPVVGGFLTGVASTVDAKAVKIYRGGKKYSRWEFIWNPLEDAVSSGSSAQGGGVLPGQPGGVMPGGIGGNIPGASPNPLGGNNPNNPNPTQPQPQQPQQPPPQ
jgi:hypothetical protein